MQFKLTAFYAFGFLELFKVDVYSEPQILDNNLSCENLKLEQAERSLECPVKENTTVKS